MVFFRCDGSKTIGTGHLVRCLALADRLIEKGLEVEFISSELPNSFPDRIKSHGVGLNMIESESEVHTLLIQKPASCIVVDHYGLGEEWERVQSQFTKVIAIDDFPGRKHHCSVLIDPSFRENPTNTFHGLVNEGARIYSGPNVHMIRSDFLNQERKEYSERKSVLVFFGGGQTAELAIKLVHALKSRGSFDVPMTLLLGRDMTELKVQIENEKLPNISVLVDPPNLAEVFCTHRLFFGSGGTVTWERLLCGLPGIVTTVVDNQVPASTALANSGYQYYIGPSAELDFNIALSQIEYHYSQVDKLEKMSLNGIKLMANTQPDFLKEFMD